MAGLAAVLAPRTREKKSPVLRLERDTEWFGALYEESVDSVYRYAHVLVRDRDRAEDVAADVFLQAWRNRTSLRDERRALPWLLSITHNAAISLLRATKEVAGLDEVAEPEDTSADPSSELFSELEAARVHEAIARLTPEQQQVVFLRFFEGRTHEDVATRLGSNANAVRAIQFRALSRLRKLLQEEPGASLA